MAPLTSLCIFLPLLVTAVAGQKTVTKVRTVTHTTTKVTTTTVSAAAGASLISSIGFDFDPLTFSPAVGVSSFGAKSDTSKARTGSGYFELDLDTSSANVGAGTLIGTVSGVVTGRTYNVGVHAKTGGVQDNCQLQVSVEVPGSTGAPIASTGMTALSSDYLLVSTDFTGQGKTLNYVYTMQCNNDTLAPSVFLDDSLLFVRRAT